MFVSNPSKSKLLNYNLCLNVTLEHIISRACQMVEPEVHVILNWIFKSNLVSSTARFNYIALKEHPLYSRCCKVSSHFHKLKI